ncbi:hypothetical protein GQ600_1675 [Phytophthora cactorum]|nr:hypothetical protein GQ600_1675 [Phytophthora cactorum]
MRGQTKKKHIFAHNLLVISWNLMCHTGNSVSIRYEHLEWDEDSLAVWFGHMKNDQEGDRQCDPRHIFANPMEPDICPILSLAIYFAVVGFSKTSLLFPGQNQYDRYSRILKSVMDISSAAEEMEIAGRVPSDYGSHSARKGLVGICLECKTRMFDTEAAGDRVVGRFVAGLPYETPDFAILPPFFDTVDDNVWNGISICYPNAPERFNIYMHVHAGFTGTSHGALEANDHLLFSTSLFRDTTLLSELKPKVVCQRWQTGDAIRASGIPPHLGVVVNMEDRLDSVDKSIAELHSTDAYNVHRMQGQLNSMEAKVDGLT